MYDLVHNEEHNNTNNSEITIYIDKSVTILTLQTHIPKKFLLIIKINLHTIYKNPKTLLSKYERFYTLH